MGVDLQSTLDQPVAPRKKRMVALGLFAGLVAGSGAALLVDRRTGLVYSKDELKCLMPCPLIKHLPAINGSAWTDTADLLAAGPLAPLGTVQLPSSLSATFQTSNFEPSVKNSARALEGRELLVSTDLRQTSRCATQLLLTSQGVATRIQLSQLRQELALQGTPLAGWVLLDPDLNLG